MRGITIFFALILAYFAVYFNLPEDIRRGAEMIISSMAVGYALARVALWLDENIS